MTERRENRQWQIAALPEGPLRADHFTLATVPVPELAPGEALIRNRLLSIDAGYRGWLQGANYAFSLAPGQVLPGTGLGEVVRSRADALAPGDLVAGALGWQDYAVTRAGDVERREADLPDDAILALFGGTRGRSGALVSHYGMVDIGRPRAGETVLVSAAAGYVGVVAAQIARIAGCRVVGSAGGGEKARWLTEEIGLDAVVDRRAGDLAGQLRAACPNGIDIFFDNTAGEILELALGLMNLHGRIVCCGAVSEYDGALPAAGPRGVPQTLITKRLRMEGFLTMDCPDRPAAERQLVEWVSTGRLVLPTAVVAGLEKAPETLVGVLAGRFRGKALVRV